MLLWLEINSWTRMIHYNGCAVDWFAMSSGVYLCVYTHAESICEQDSPYVFKNVFQATTVVINNFL